MKLVVSVMFVASVAFSFTAYGHQIPKDQCSLLTAADLEAVLGKGAVPAAVGEQECRYKSPQGSYEVHVRRQNGASELKEWTEFSMAKPVAPVKDIGDEAFVSQNQNTVAFRKGSVAVRVSASAVRPPAPMKFQEGVVEVAKRIAAKLK